MPAPARTEARRPACPECAQDLEHCHGTAITHFDGTGDCTDDPDCRLAAEQHSGTISCSEVGMPLRSPAPLGQLASSLRRRVLTGPAAAGGGPGGCAATPRLRGHNLPRLCGYATLRGSGCR